MNVQCVPCYFTMESAITHWNWANFCCWNFLWNFVHIHTEMHCGVDMANLKFEVNIFILYQDIETLIFLKCVKNAKRNRLVRWKVERRMADFWQTCNWFFNNKSGPLQAQFCSNQLFPMFLTVRLNFQAIVFYVF